MHIAVVAVIGRLWLVRLGVFNPRECPALRYVISRVFDKPAFKHFLHVLGQLKTFMRCFLVCTELRATCFNWRLLGLDRPFKHTVFAVLRYAFIAKSAQVKP